MKAAQMLLDENELTVVGLALTRLKLDLKDPERFVRSLRRHGPQPPADAKESLPEVDATVSRALAKVMVVLQIMDADGLAPDCGSATCHAHDAIRQIPKVEVKRDGGVRL